MIRKVIKVRIYVYIGAVSGSKALTRTYRLSISLPRRSKTWDLNSSIAWRTCLQEPSIVAGKRVCFPFLLLKSNPTKRSCFHFLLKSNPPTKWKMKLCRFRVSSFSIFMLRVIIKKKICV